MTKYASIFLTIFALVGCEEEAAPPEPANNPPAEAEQGEAEQAEEAAPEAADNPLVGTWKIVPNEDLEMMIGLLETMSESAPEDRRAEMQAAIEGLRNAELTFAADSVEMKVGPEEKSGSYTIDSQEGDQITVTITDAESNESETDTYTLSEDGQQLSLTEDGQTMTFARQG